MTHPTFNPVKYAYWGPHPLFTQPPPDAGMWRYLSLAKLVAMLETRALHFARADQMNDPFEGSWTKGDAPHVYQLRGHRVLAPQWSQEELNGQVGATTPEMLAAEWRDRRESAALSCWYMGAHESAAMWLLYAAEGIAVETRFDSFLQSLPKGASGDGTESIIVSLVNYIDYEKAVMPPANECWPFLHKRLSFAHEHEVRAMILGYPVFEVDRGKLKAAGPVIPPGGVSIPVDVETLIRKVYVAPSSPGWVADAVKAVVRRFGYEFPVEQSRLDASPFY